MHYLHINAASWLGVEHSMWWQQPFSQIFLSSLLTHLSKAYPSKQGCPLPSICWVVELQTSVLLSEEVWLFGQHHLFVVIGHRPWPLNLLVLINTWLSSGSLASLVMAHGPIPLLDPFIPTWFVYHVLLLSLINLNVHAINMS